MTIQVTPAFVTFFVFIVGYMVASIWWAATLTATIKSLNDKLDRIDKDFTKQEGQITALWRKYDEMNAKIGAA